MSNPPSGIREIRSEGLLERDRTVPYPISSPDRTRTVPVSVTVSAEQRDQTRGFAALKRTIRDRGNEIRELNQQLRDKDTVIGEKEDRERQMLALIGKLIAENNTLKAEKANLIELVGDNVEGLNVRK